MGVIYALELGDESHIPYLPISLSEFELTPEQVLCRSSYLHGEPVTQTVIPDALVPVVLRLLHDVFLAAHPGRDKTLQNARKQYYWLILRSDVKKHVLECVTCAENKGHVTPPTPMLNYPTPAAPMDVIDIYLLQLPASHQGSHYALVCVDHFSRFVILAPLENKSTEAVVHALITHVFCLFSTPRDNGVEFKNHVLEAVCKYFGVTQTFIAAYHPASNGLVERTHIKILEVLSPIVGSMQHAWQDWLPLVAASINSSVCSSTEKIISLHYF